MIFKDIITYTFMTLRDRCIECWTQKLNVVDELYDEPKMASLVIDGTLLKWYKEYLKADKKYRYMITFTVDPNKVDYKKEESSIEEYIKTQAKRSALKIVSWDMVREYTKKKIPHWHCAVLSTKHISKDRFNYYIKKYGNIDISITRSQHSQETINYMSKTDAPIQKVV